MRQSKDTLGTSRDRSPSLPQSWKVVLAATLPFLVYVAHGTFFLSWQIDDAGISYAYARNLSNGEGLVAQPDTEPVEGFTNLLWVVILAAVMPVVESPDVAARMLSYASVLLAFLILSFGMCSWFPQRWFPATMLGLSATALITGFPAWTLSGMENGLHALLIAAFLVGATLCSNSWSGGSLMGLAWVLLFASRPDAAPLIVIPPMVWARERNTASLSAFALLAASGFAGLTFFRVLYFGDVLPNTYYAKHVIGSDILGVIPWSASTGTLFVLAGAVAISVMVVAAYFLAYRAIWRRGTRSGSVGLATLFAALTVLYITFETLPNDWMPEGRFATPLMLLAPITVLATVRRHSFLSGTLGAALLALTATYSAKHTPKFVENPPAPFESVIDLAVRLDSVFEVLGTAQPNGVLLPDIGGALWENRFPVIDLAGLIDPSIARTLHDENKEKFMDYVLEVRRPELIWSHGFWSERTGLDRYPPVAEKYDVLLADGVHVLYLRTDAVGVVERKEFLDAFATGNR